MLSDLLPLYQDYQLNRRKQRPRGVERYMCLLRQCFAELGDGAGLDDLTPGWLDAYITAQGKLWSANTVLLALSALRSFCTWAVKTGYLTSDPTKGLDAPKKHNPAPKPLSRQQLRDLWRVLADDDDDERSREVWARYRRAIALMLFAGLRLEEVTRLRWADVELEARSLVVREGKGGKARAIPLHPSLVVELQRAQFREPSAPVVPNAHGQQYAHAKYLAHLFDHTLPNRARRRGVRLKFSGHQLRHTFATEMLRGGADLRNIQELLGHKQIETTMRYLAVVPDTLRAAVASVPTSW